MKTTSDKIKRLLRQPYKLVLIQQQELESLRSLKSLIDYDIRYVDQLYEHYIVKGLGKTYLE